MATIEKLEKSPDAAATDGVTDSSMPLVTGFTDEALWRDDRRLAAVPAVAAETLLGATSRAVIVAPHPDDEVLGCAGLLMQLTRLGHEILLIAVSDGEKSHGSESVFSPALLSHVRPAETTAALSLLGITDITIIRAHLPDSSVSAHRGKLQDFLGAYLRHGDTVFASWQGDGHPDHEAVGLASRDAAFTMGCRLIEIPIWMWHWRLPDHAAIPWRRARKLLLDEDMQARKQAALAAYRSQLEPDQSTGSAAILPAEVLAHFQRPFEIYFV